jgi:hypothetical protein
MEPPISVRRRLICGPIYAAMIGGGAFLVYETLEGLNLKGMILAGGFLLAIGSYLMWTDIIRPLFRNKT